MRYALCVLGRLAGLRTLANSFGSVVTGESPSLTLPATLKPPFKPVSFDTSWGKPVFVLRIVIHVLGGGFPSRVHA
jgi:hypothetical protein